MNKRFDFNTDPLLAHIVNQTEETLSCPKFKEYSDQIDIDTWENIKLLMQRNKTVAESGFGFCITNFFELGEFKRIIIINMDNCKKANCTEREVTAILYHELGHLLNTPQLEPVPTIMDFFLYGNEYSADLAEGVRNKNSIKMEVYADSYANQYGYGSELISTFYKQNQYFEQKIGYFEQRLKEINSKIFFEGCVAPIDTNGW